MQNDEKILRRLEQILKRTTANGATEAEATQALQYAQKLMSEHNIELSQVEGYAQSLSDSDIRDFIARAVVSPQLFEKFLASAVSKLFECRCYQRKNQKGKTEIHFVGFDLDVRAATATYLELLVAARAFARGYYGSGWSATHSNFCKGFAVGVCKTVEAIEDERQRQWQVPSSSTALMVRKGDLIKARMDSLGCTKGAARKFKVGEGYAEGQLEGQSYQISPNANRAKVS